MGAGASSKKKYDTIQEALSDGHTKDEIDKYLGESPVKPAKLKLLEDEAYAELGVGLSPVVVRSPRSSDVMESRRHKYTDDAYEEFNHAVSSFLPPRIRDKLVKSENMGKKLTVPQKGGITACVAFLDMCGFTKLLFEMKSWTRWSKWPRYLQTYFQKLTNSADEHGIDLYKFAGDLLIFYLVVDEDSAAACKLAVCRMVQWVQLALKEAQVSNDGVTLQMHGGVVIGQMQEVLVGGGSTSTGINIPYDYILCGDLLKEQSQVRCSFR